jgi:hypothetical protein
VKEIKFENFNICENNINSVELAKVLTKVACLLARVNWHLHLLE